MADPRIAIELALQLKSLRSELKAGGDLTAAEIRRALGTVSKTARQMQKETTKAAREAQREAQLAATVKAEAEAETARQIRAHQLERMSRSQRVAAKLQEEIAAIHRLREAGADAARVEQLRVLAVERGAVRIAAARQKELATVSGDAVSGVPAGGAAAARDLAAATGAAATKMAALKDTGRSLALQLPDVWTQLAMGAPVSQVLVQQGLQVVQMSMGSLATLGRGLAGLLSGPVVVGLAAVGTVAVSAANAVQEHREAQRGLWDALESTAAALRVEELDSYAQAQREMREAVADSEEMLRLEQGRLSQLEVAQWKAVESVRESARAATLEAAAVWARLEVQRQELEARVASRDLTYAEAQAAFARLEVLRRELPVAESRINQLKEETQEKQLAVFTNYEEVAALRASATAQKDAAKASRDRSRAEREAARALAERSKADAELRQKMLQQDRDRIAATRDLKALELERLQARAARTQEIVDIERAATAEMRAQIGALAERADAQIQAGADEAAVAAEFLASETEARLQAEQTVADARRAALEQERQERMDWIAQQTQLYSAMAGNMLSAMTTLAASELAVRSGRARELRAFLEANEEGLNESQKKRLRAAAKAEEQAARKAFRWQQAGQVSAAAMAGSVAAVRALSDLGPTPVGWAMVGTVGTFTGAQIASIVRQQPPVFDYGGQVPLSTAASTHTMVAARQGEHVMTDTGVAALGGHERLEAANRGELQGGSQGDWRIGLELGGEVLQELVVRAGRGSGGGGAMRVNHYSGVRR